MRIKSFAKINLGLEVLGKREDGFHEIRTLFQAIDFFDVLEFREIPGDKIALLGSTDNISWGEDNLVHRAAAMLKEKTGWSRGVEIHVEKNIPAGGGLGGGSSNAAITLYALNRFWNLGFTPAELSRMGMRLGSDVPYFLRGGLCLGSGRGERITEKEDLPAYSCLLFPPDVFISTAEVYQNLGISLTSKGKVSKISRFLDNRNLYELENDLEETVFTLFPQIKARKNLMRSLGAGLSAVSGSGSAVFGLFPDKEKAGKAFEEIKSGQDALLVETLSRERYWHDITAGV
jgi:4-diphosphocytidyl-2-C-methyl-D-erythritol kinase